MVESNPTFSLRTLEMLHPLPRFSKDLLGLAAAIRLRHPIRERRDFRFGRLSVLAESNSHELMEGLQRYFQPFLRDWNLEEPVAHDGLLVTALESSIPHFNLPFRDWPREPGKTRLKERFADVPRGRVVHKVRTGMHFLVGHSMRLAVGPCLANLNQVINFIVTQVIENGLREGWQLCHAAGVSMGNRGLTLAGFAGAGKSTLALHLMRHGTCFVSNDRILAKRFDSRTLQAGVPKLPRINPGTALNHPQLRAIVPAERQRALESLDPTALWDLEEKYDVDLDGAFGPGRLSRVSGLDALVILAWRRGDSTKASLRRVDLEARPDLVDLVAKSPGPFLLAPHRHEITNPKQSLRDHLRDVPTYEMVGGVDFEHGSALCLDLLRHPERP
jgi:HprK-related kinase B